MTMPRIYILCNFKLNLQTQNVVVIIGFLKVTLCNAEGLGDETFFIPQQIYGRRDLSDFYNYQTAGRGLKYLIDPTMKTAF